jgi:Zn-dependent protease
MTQSLAVFFAQLAILLPGVLVGISFHEFAHAFVAYLLGDNTAKQQGRMTVNPLSHIDFLGMLCLILFKIGWAKPVQIDNRNFKYPKTSSILISLAGPFANFLVALFLMYLIIYFPMQHFSRAFELSFHQLFGEMIYINIGLGVFNLIPIPPLDGSHILTVFLADKFPNFILWLYRYSFIILLLLILLPQTQEFLGNLISIAELLIQKLVF